MRVGPGTGWRTVSYCAGIHAPYRGTGARVVQGGVRALPLGGSDLPLRRDGFPPPYQVRGHAFAGMTDGSALVWFVPAIRPGSVVCWPPPFEPGRAVREPPLRPRLAGRPLRPGPQSRLVPRLGGELSVPCRALTPTTSPRGCRRRSPADTWGSRIPPPQDVPGWLTARLIRLLSRLGLSACQGCGAALATVLLGFPSSPHLERGRPIWHWVSWRDAEAHIRPSLTAAGPIPTSVAARPLQNWWRSVWARLEYAPSGLLLG